MYLGFEHVGVVEIDFVAKSIAIKNLPKGENKEFFEKDAVIDIDYFKTNKYFENTTYYIK